MSKLDDFEIDNHVLLKYTGQDAEVTIPDGVTFIDAEAFDGCGNLVINAPAGSYAATYAEKNKIELNLI